VAPREIQMKTNENKSGTMWRLRGEGSEAEEETTRFRRRKRWRRTWKRLWRRRKRKRKM